MHVIHKIYLFNLIHGENNKGVQTSITIIFIIYTLSKLYL